MPTQLPFSTYDDGQPGLTVILVGNKAPSLHCWPSSLWAIKRRGCIFTGNRIFLREFMRSMRLGLPFVEMPPPSPPGSVFLEGVFSESGQLLIR